MPANRASWRSRVIRAGAAASIASGLIGLALAPVPEPYLAAWFRQPVMGPVLAAEHLLAVAGLIALLLSMACGEGLLPKAGIGMLRARRWDGWQRFLPLATGLYLPIVFLPAEALKFERGLAIGIWGIGFVLLGAAIWVREASPRC